MMSFTMEADISVWLEAILQHDESAIAADWLKEQPSAVVERLLLDLKTEVDRRSLILVWGDGTRHAEAYFSECHHQWVFTRFDGGRHRIVEKWIEVGSPGHWSYGTRWTAICLACDLETPGGRWVLTPDWLERTLQHGEILRAGTADGHVLIGVAARDWWLQENVL
jgi:hypothetical protein